MNTARSTIHRFNTLRAARSFAAHATKIMMVVLGDHDDPAPYWVVIPSDAARLQRAGYELA